MRLTALSGIVSGNRGSGPRIRLGRWNRFQKWVFDLAVTRGTGALFDRESIPETELRRGSATGDAASGPESIPRSRAPGVETIPGLPLPGSEAKLHSAGVTVGGLPKARKNSKGTGKSVVVLLGPEISTMVCR